MLFRRVSVLIDRNAVDAVLGGIQSSPFYEPDRIAFFAGKSVLLANLMAKVEYGNREKEQHLFSRQAERGKPGGQKNPYDPVILDNPTIKKWPMQTLAKVKDALDQIEEQAKEKGVILLLFLWLHRQC